MKRRMSGVPVLFLALIGALLVVPAAPVAAVGPILVTTTLDVVDPDDGELSLREAVLEANATPGADEVLLEPATYELTLCASGTSPDVLDPGEALEVAAGEAITIVGNGATLTQLCGAHQPAAFVVYSGASFGLVGLTIDSTYQHLWSYSDVSLDGVTLRGAGSTWTAAAVVDGANLVVSDSLFEDNLTTTLRIEGSTGVPSVPASIVDSTFRGNDALGRTAGAVLAEEQPIVIERSQFSDNITYDSLDHPGVLSGAGAVRAGAGVIQDCDFQGNAGAHGGAVMGSFEIRRSTFAGNRGYGAGAIFTGVGQDPGSTTLTVEESTLTGNRSAQWGGAITAVGGDTSITASTIADNTALRSGPLLPSTTIFVENGDLDVARSTITDNTADGAAVISAHSEPGDPVDLPAVSIVDSTIADNTSSGVAPSAGIVFDENPFNPGGTGGSLQMERSVVTSATPAVCSLGARPFASEGWNLVSDASCGSPDATDLIGVDPLLGPLTDNWGLTSTRRPLPGSPLISRIPSSDVACGGEDQRGVSRPQGSGCEPGAFEAGDGPVVSLGNARIEEPRPGKAKPAVSLPIALSGPATGDVYVMVFPVGGSATAGTDFVAKPKTVRIPAGRTFAAVPVRVVGDGVADGGETVELEGEIVSGPAELLDKRGVVTIDDPSVGAGLRVSDVTVTEARAGKPLVAYVTVTLDEPLLVPVTFTWTVNGVTAANGSDVLAKSGVKTLKAGRTSVRIPVKLFPDTDVEPDELAQVVLSDPSGAPIVDDAGDVTIRNLP